MKRISTEQLQTYIDTRFAMRQLGEPFDEAPQPLGNRAALFCIGRLFSSEGKSWLLVDVDHEKNVCTGARVHSDGSVYEQAFPMPRPRPA